MACRGEGKIATASRGRYITTMSILKFPVSRDDAVYQAWPDLTLCPSGRLVCVFAECTHHGNRDYTRIDVCDSTDRGRTWSLKRALTEPLYRRGELEKHWNCPRIVQLNDGRLCAIVDRVGGPRMDSAAKLQENFLLFSSDEGQTWSDPQWTPIDGIVPDKLSELKRGPHAGRWLLTCHTGRNDPWIVRTWISDDQGATWSDPTLIAAVDGLKLCEPSVLELPGGELVVFLREQSMKGWDAYKSISRDGGRTWGPVHAFASPGCHRPVTGILQNGKVMITHRYLPGGKGGWGNMTQNMFATITDVESCLAEKREDQATRVLPIDFDRSPEADTGYTGWVQFDDGEIYIVNYILDDAPKGQIRGYSLRFEDFILPAF
jgi:sialidase-1